MALIATMAKQKRIDVRTTRIEPPGSAPSWLPAIHHGVLKTLIEDDEELARSVWRARAKVAEAAIAQRLQREVVIDTSYCLPSGRLLTRTVDGGTDGCLELAWIDPDGEVGTRELPGVRRGDDWMPSTDGRRIVMAGKGPYGLVEADLDDGSRRLVWEVDPRTTDLGSFSYEYCGPDRVLVAADVRTGGGRFLLLARRGETMVELDRIDDVSCESFRFLAPFAFLEPASNSKKRIVIAVVGDRLVMLGVCAFPADPWDLDQLDGEVVFTKGDDVLRVDGLREALRAATPADPLADTQEAAPALTGYDQRRALRDALNIGRAAKGRHAAYRRKLLDALRVGETAFDFFLADVPKRTEAELREEPEYALVAWMNENGITLYAIPDAAMDDRQRAAVERARGGFAEHIDVGSVDDWWAILRVMAALGEPGDFEELERNELKATWRTWAEHRVRTAADLDRRFTRVCALELLTG